MRAAVVGLGKIGLPLAVQIAGAGIETVGCDSSRHVVDLVASGEPPFPGEPELRERLHAALDAGQLTVTADNSAGAGSADAIVVAVPLLLDDVGRPDFRAVDAVTGEVAATLEPGRLISYETTLPVGTTRRRLGAALHDGSGLRPGTDFHLVHSPERVSSGTVFRDLSIYPKLVGGVDPASTEAGARFYESFLSFEERPDLPRPNGVWRMESAEAAELTKLAETTYRDVNIALANEFARHAEDIGIDVWEVIEAANSQPYSHIHRPGVAVGGHCIPVYPHLYTYGDRNATLAGAGRSLNEQVPLRAVAAVAAELGDLRGKTVVVLGAAFRGGVKEAYNSGVFPLAAEIRRRGGTPVVHDPLFDDAELGELGLDPYRMGQGCEAAILQADHAEYRSLKPTDFPGCRVVYDGRGILDPTLWKTSSVRCLRIGSPRR